MPPNEWAGFMVSWSCSRRRLTTDDRRPTTTMRKEFPPFSSRIFPFLLQFLKLKFEIIVPTIYIIASTSEFVAQFPAKNQKVVQKWREEKWLPIHSFNIPPSTNSITITIDTSAAGKVEGLDHEQWTARNVACVGAIVNLNQYHVHRK